MVRAGYLRASVSHCRGVLTIHYTIGLPHVGPVSNYEFHKTHFEGSTCLFWPSSRQPPTSLCFNSQWSR